MKSILNTVVLAFPLAFAIHFGIQLGSGKSSEPIPCIINLSCAAALTVVRIIELAKEK